MAQDGVEALEYLFATSGDVGDSTPTSSLTGISPPGISSLEMQQDSPAERPRNPLPTIILLDVQLPRINGLEVLQQIRSHPRTRVIPVIILTTSNEQQDLLTSYELGCNSYIRKPVDYSEFLNVIQQLGLYWLVINTSPILQ
ncbi:response regulator [Leptolyngbya sp. 7M]|uniref:response regulator n=1 Tax=Leptolyngbya sp. 7M TaxID=2812896 RepID=UPI0021F13E03|nr:response regulator [Leptolyngbya sp. 7M]